MAFRQLLFGRPLRTDEERRLGVNVFGGLAILSPDALSSVAYGTQEILITLAPFGLVATWYSLPISAVITALLLFLVLSYRQVIDAFPHGGGAYALGKEELGTGASLVAGASLLIDYTLTVAVSVTAGVDALVSAFPGLAPWRVLVDLVLIWFITFFNLRGSGESIAITALPVYLFIAMVLTMVGVGFARPSIAPTPVFHAPLVKGVTLLLLMRAFSSGASALTGVEAISNGVPVFRPPSTRNAKTTLALLGLFLGLMFLGTSVMAHRFAIVPGQLTVLEAIAAHLFGRGLYFYVLSFVTMAILAVAANTSFVGFPYLASRMAQDRYMPHMFLSRGDRLVYQNGIVVLSVLASLLVIFARGNTDALIPMYAIGVYVGFTITQASLVKRHLREHVAWKVFVPSVGAVLTATVVVVALISKFVEGAWVVVVVMAGLLAWFVNNHQHYERVREQLRLHRLPRPDPTKVLAVVPVDSLNRMSEFAINYATSITDQVVVFHVAMNEEDANEIEQRWNERWKDLYPQARLAVVISQYRSVLRPCARLVDHLAPHHRVTVVIPEFVVRRTYHGILHNQVGLRLAAMLFARKDVAVTLLPFHLAD